MPELDRKANTVFAGKVVRKDLVRRVKVGANVPVYVLEYLLGKYCATDDPVAVEAGLRVVNSTLTDHFVRPDEANKAIFRLKDRGRGTYIDKVRVRALEDKDWAEMANLGQRYLHVQDTVVRRYPRLLEGGVWAQVELEYQPDEETDGRSRPFFVADLQPIQLARFDLEEYQQGRASFTTDEWMDLLVRSVGLEPAHYPRRLKLLLLTRLIPMVERNYNLVELGPRGTGKSFVYRELTPYAILVSGGRTTVANLFYNMATNKLGLVGLWDVVAFDEVAGIEFSDKTAVQIMKDFMEAGSFSRGREELIAEASLVFLGNINQPLELLLKTSHLFAPLPEAMRSDMALIDRFHAYLPGWEAPKMETRFLTDHYGFVVDYLAEALRELRRHNFTDEIDGHFALGPHLNARDARAVRKTVAGLVKLLHPDRQVSRDELREYLELALEYRRRVKEQLKKMGSFEYYQTSFSYTETDTMQERFVGVPEEGGRDLISPEPGGRGSGDLISPDPLPPGSVYTATLTDANTVALHRLEVGRLSGSGRLRITGNVGRALRESLTTAHDYLRARRRELGIEKDLESYDFHVQLVDLMAGKEGSEVGVAFFVALFSLLKDRPVQAGLVVLGEMTIQGNILPVRSLQEPLRVAMDNGARKALIPVESRRAFLDVPGDIAERVDPIFYSDPLSAAHKALA